MHIETIPQMILTTGAGLVISFTDLESGFRLLSIGISTFLSVAVYLRDRKKRRKDEEDN